MCRALAGSCRLWDVFISHASEDKQAVALPLADSLTRSGLKIWLDRFELRLGDSLREKIDDGLAESAFGVVILSEHFLNKGWPKNELNGLFALEEGGVKVILPVWHGVDKGTVAKYSPILADRLAANTADGIPTVARMIAQVVLEEGAKLGRRDNSLATQFIAILAQGPSPLDVSTFLTTYPRVLGIALGAGGKALARPDLGSWTDRIFLAGSAIRPDLAIEGGSTVRSWIHCFFCPAQGPFFARGKPKGELRKAIQKVEALMRWLPNHAEDFKRALNLEYLDHDEEHHALVLAGRRDELSESDRQTIRRLKTKEFEIRSYDWIIEACIAAEQAMKATAEESKDPY